MLEIPTSQFNFKNLIYASLSFLFASFGVFFLYAAIHDDENERVDYADIFADALEIAYASGYIDEKIDYEDPLINMRKIYLVNDINEKTVKRVIKILSYLDEKDPGKPIDLYIDTSGGRAGLMLVSFMEGLRSPVNTHALDWVSSAGAMILAAGTGQRYAYQYSRISVHINPVTKNGRHDDGEFNSVNRYRSVFENFWKKHANLPSRFYPFDKEVFYEFNSKQALDVGVVDKIIVNPIGY